MFQCKVKQESKEIGNGIAPDEGQISVEWLPLSELLSYRLYPQTMRQHIIDYNTGKDLVLYLGDIN